MIEGPDAVTTSALRLAMDAAALRQRAYTLNIANAGSTGYMPLQVEFETQMSAARSSLARSGSIQPSNLVGVGAQLEAALDPSGQPQAIELDTVAFKLAQNALHFQALLHGLNHHFSIRSSAAGDGRR